MKYEGVDREEKGKKVGQLQYSRESNFNEPRICNFRVKRLLHEIENRRKRKVSEVCMESYSFMHRQTFVLIERSFYCNRLVVEY